MHWPLSNASPSWVSLTETVRVDPGLLDPLDRLRGTPRRRRSLPRGSMTPSPRRSRIPPIPFAFSSLMTWIASSRSVARHEALDDVLRRAALR